MNPGSSCLLPHQCQASSVLSLLWHVRCLSLGTSVISKPEDIMLASGDLKTRPRGSSVVPRVAADVSKLQSYIVEKKREAQSIT